MRNPYEYEREDGWDYCHVSGRTTSEGFTHVGVSCLHGTEQRPYDSQTFDYRSFEDTRKMLEKLEADGWEMVAAILGLGERDELNRIYRRAPETSPADHGSA